MYFFKQIISLSLHVNWHGMVYQGQGLTFLKKESHWYEAFVGVMTWLRWPQQKGDTPQVTINKENFYSTKSNQI